MNKLELLQEELRNYGKVAIAYSGGVDSNFLFHVALETLGKENVLPVLCRGAMMSKEDIEGALEKLFILIIKIVVIIVKEALCQKLLPLLKNMTLLMF